MLRASEYVLAFAVLAASLVACGTPTDGPGNSEAPSPSHSSQVFGKDTELLSYGGNSIIVRSSPDPNTAQVDALVEGTLRAEEYGCLVVVNEETNARSAIKFPYGSSLSEQGVKLPGGQYLGIDQSFSVGGGSRDMEAVLPQDLVEKCRLSGIQEIFVINPE